jgi:hypothetical protein
MGALADLEALEKRKPRCWCVESKHISSVAQSLSWSLKILSYSGSQRSLSVEGNILILMWLKLPSSVVQFMITHEHLEQRLRMSGDMPLLPPTPMPSCFAQRHHYLSLANKLTCLKRYVTEPFAMQVGTLLPAFRDIKSVSSSGLKGLFLVA